MTRDELADYLGARYQAYLDAVSRTAADSADNLAHVIDDALRALGYAAADIPSAAPTDPEAEEDLRVQGEYRLMAQVSRDLGATSFDVSTGGDSFKLSQLRAAAEKDLARTEAAVLDRFGTTSVVSTGESSGLVTIDLNFLTPRGEEVA